jgi:hypothetical protein
MLAPHDRFCGVCGTRRGESAPADEAISDVPAAPDAPAFTGKDEPAELDSSGNDSPTFEPARTPAESADSSHAPVNEPEVNEPRKNEMSVDESRTDEPHADEARASESPTSEAGASELPSTEPRTNEPRTSVVNATSTGGRASSNKPLEESTVLNNRYEIVRRIGGGGMGAGLLRERPKPWRRAARRQGNDSIATRPGAA